MPFRSLAFAAALAWAVVAAGGAALGWWLVRFWGASPAAADHLLVLPAAVWLLVRQAGLLRRRPRSPTPRGLALIALATVFTPPAWFLYAQVGPMPLLLWWLAAAVILAAAGLVLVQLGSGHLRALAFPLLFILFALPVPQRIQAALQNQLQEATTSLAAAGLPLLGIPAARSGFVLRLPSGELGVVEACSGVRAVTAIVAVAALLAHLRGFGLARGAVLVALALPVIAVANAVRVILSGLLQEALGPWVNQGAAHEALGALTLLVGLGCVLGLAHAASRGAGEQGSRGEKQAPAVLAPAPLLPCSPASSGAAGLLVLALVGSVGAVWHAGRIVPGEEPDAPLDTIARRIGPWVGEDVPADAAILATLACDRAIHRVYRNPAGQPVHVWVIHWTAASAVKDYIHHPDVCWPNRGWTTIGQERRPVPLPSPMSLSLTVRRFERDGRRQMVGYWAQDGADVWSEEDERQAATGWPSQRWVLDRLFSDAPRRRTPRLVVLVGADLWDATGYAEQAVGEFVRDFAAELYRVCPWAQPR